MRAAVRNRKTCLQIDAVGDVLDRADSLVTALATAISNEGRAEHLVALRPASSVTSSIAKAWVGRHVKLGGCHRSRMVVRRGSGRPCSR